MEHMFDNSAKLNLLSIEAIIFFFAQELTRKDKKLECSEECFKLERNKRLSLALQIRNPDLSAKITPRYSDFMKDFVKKDAKFCSNIHDELTKLVQLAKEVKIVCFVKDIFR